MTSVLTVYQLMVLGILTVDNKTCGAVIGEREITMTSVGVVTAVNRERERERERETETETETETDRQTDRQKQRHRDTTREGGRGTVSK